MNDLDTPAIAGIRKAMADSDWLQVVRLSRKQLRKDARSLGAHRYLGYALKRLGKVDEAYKAFEQGLVWWKDDAELLINYADALLDNALNERALPIFRRVCDLRPDHVSVWIKLSECCYAPSLHQEGLNAANKAMELAKTDIDRFNAYVKRGIHRREFGDIAGAVADCHEAINIYPQTAFPYTNLLLFMLADPSASTADVAQAAFKFSERIEQPLMGSWPTFNDTDRSPWRRLRIGFLSPDFRMHSVMYFAEGLLAQIDRARFEVCAFYLFPRDDTATERVRCHVDQFIELAGMQPQEQLDLIRSKDIDILIDLAGHTGNNGLHILMRKAAPVQVTTIGYPGTTGLKAVDWWISDAVTDPPGAERFYSERVMRLPTRWVCYRPHIRNPLWRYQPAYAVSESPAQRDGFVTFGSCNNLGKLTDEVLTTWGRILAITPGARLLIEGKGLDDIGFAQRYKDRCEALGIARERLEVMGLDQRNQYLTYHRIDIALDPFPLVGGTTSNDLLWMGVPLVTLLGDSVKSRMGAGILSHLGRHDWIARDVDEYVEIAVRLASDVKALAALRNGLRAEVEASVLMREDVFTPVFERALRLMWLDWVARCEATEREIEDENAVAWVDNRVGQLLDAEPALEPVEFHVGVMAGERVPLTRAYERLHTLIERAQARGGAPSDEPVDGISDRHWRQATELAERILCAKPHDPVALTALAEIENAHGHADFGRVYLMHALKSIAGVEPADAVLERTHRFVTDALERLSESRPMGT